MNMVSFAKKEILNVLAAILCAYTLSVLINQTVFLAFLNKAQPSATHTGSEKTTDGSKPLVSVDTILQKNFFEKADEVFEEGEAVQTENTASSDLELLGTITGSYSTAKALIRKKSGNTSDVFKHGDDVFGYRLKSIRDTTVLLLSGKTEVILDMYPVGKTENAASSPSEAKGGTISKTYSRAELIQDTQNNLDNMLRGIRTGPYRENNVVVGYELKSVSSANLLYKYGMRSGDIIRRINGHPIDSTAKLMELWQQFPKESRVLIDIQRKGAITTFDFTISD